jgi:hypothetical protein
MSFFSK